MRTVGGERLAAVPALDGGDREPGLAEHQLDLVAEDRPPPHLVRGADDDPGGVDLVVPAVQPLPLALAQRIAHREPGVAAAGVDPAPGEERRRHRIAAKVELQRIHQVQHERAARAQVVRGGSQRAALPVEVADDQQAVEPAHGQGEVPAPQVEFGDVLFDQGDPVADGGGFAVEFGLEEPQDPRGHVDGGHAVAVAGQRQGDPAAAAAQLEDVAVGGQGAGQLDVAVGVVADSLEDRDLVHVVRVGIAGGGRVVAVVEADGRVVVGGVHVHGPMISGATGDGWRIGDVILCADSSLSRLVSMARKRNGGAFDPEGVASKAPPVRVKWERQHTKDHAQLRCAHPSSGFAKQQGLQPVSLTPIP
nr:hypothetical protein [Stackebrandtia nassauensis]